VARALKAEDVEAIFTLCGGHIIDIYDGCFDEGIKIIDVRHEQAAAHAAGANDRAPRSIIDHMHMRTALENRDADLTACLVREHTLGWAAPMEKNVTYLDEGQLTSALG
jgi:hypothetical protein